MFYRQGGAELRINPQYDDVYTDQVDAATGWLPVNRGDNIAVNICSASIVFGSSVRSQVIKSATAPEAQIVMEMKMQGGQTDDEVWPVDQWQNIIVATSRRAHDFGWVRLRVAALNTLESKGVAMAMRVSRTGETGVAG